MISLKGVCGRSYNVLACALPAAWSQMGREIGSNKSGEVRCDKREWKKKVFYSEYTRSYTM